MHLAGFILGVAVGVVLACLFVGTTVFFLTRGLRDRQREIKSVVHGAESPFPTRTALDDRQLERLLRDAWR
jgi:hypothetical protein